MAIPNWAGGAGFNMQVFLDGAPAGPADYRTTSYGVKVRVGAAVSNLEVHYAPTGTPTPSPTPTNTPIPGDNHGLSFDGSNDVVRASQVPGTGPLTVEVWVQPATNNANTLALWHFAEGTGQVAADVSASANHGTLGSDAGADNADPAWVSGYPF